SNSMRALSGTGVFHQDSNASSAAWTAFLTSSLVETGTSAKVSPVAGLITSCVSVEEESTHSPLIMFFIFLAVIYFLLCIVIIYFVSLLVEFHFSRISTSQPYHYLHNQLHLHFHTWE